MRQGRSLLLALTALAAAGVSSLKLATSVPQNLVIVARYDEDVHWLDSMRSKGMSVEILQSFNSDAPNFVENVGNEAMKILRFIVDHYSNLPEHVIFVHAGAKDWHDPRPKNQTLLSWDWSVADKKGIAFLPTSAPCLVENSTTPRAERHLAIGRWDLVHDVDSNHECLELEQHSKQQMSTLRDAWEQTFEDELGPLPSHWVTPCCAQFEVTRSAILQHPRSFYEKVINWVRTHDKALLASEYGEDMKRNHDPQRRDAGHILEVLWILLFRSHPASVR